MGPAGAIVALGMVVNTGHVANASRSMDGQPGPNGTPKLLPEQTLTRPLDYIFPTNCNIKFVGIIPPKA